MQVLADYVRQSVVHSLVILLMGEVLLRLWALRGARQRVGIRLLSLFLPPFAYLGFLFLGPQRWQSAFSPELALLDTRPWLAAGEGPTVWLTGAFLITVMLATGLFLVQLLLFAGQRRTVPHGVPWRDAALPQLERAINSLAAAREKALPPVYVLDSADPVLYAVNGPKRGIAISRGLVAALDEEELAAVLAHEVAHEDQAVRRLRWLTWLGRTVMFYNPVAVIVLRLCLHEVEAYCDEQAGKVTGKPLACASALLKVCRQAKATSAPLRWATLAQALATRAESLQEQGEQSAVNERVERLLVGPASEREKDWQWLRLSSLAVASVGLLYLLL
ncbi:MAG: M48 family metalloprotease [Chloroflexi bacterium]|nr:M48 family metalloprotease [Chloroflexota bacterium]MCL5107545.1 M48 family metalloprotease [Chloroflexota bacterium]